VTTLRHHVWHHPDRPSRAGHASKFARPQAQASRRPGPTAPALPLRQVALVVLLLGIAIAVVLVAVLITEMAAPLPGPGRLPSPRPVGY
jgi:hypothetical protein